MKPNGSIATLIERYFTERLMRQRNVSANTIASYRDTFRLLFTFAQARLRKPPSALALEDLDVPFISAFLADLETQRGASVRTRNLRLTAIRSFFRFTSFEEPAHGALIQRVLAIPNKRHDKRQLHFLARPEIERSLRPPIARHGSDAATTPCCCSRPRQACAFPSSSASKGCRPSRRRRACAMCRQRAKGTMHAAHLARERSPQVVAQGTAAAWRDRAVPQYARGPAQRRQRPVASDQACAHRQREMSVIGVQTGVAACA